MKKLKYAVILLLGLSMATMMTSCKKDNAQLIVGKWELVTDMQFYLLGEYETYPAGTQYSFSADGITTFPLGWGFGYEVQDDIILIGRGEDVLTVKIEKLTNTTMKLSNEQIKGQCELKKVE